MREALGQNDLLKQGWCSMVGEDQQGIAKCKWQHIEDAEGDHLRGPKDMEGHLHQFLLLQESFQQSFVADHLVSA